MKGKNKTVLGLDLKKVEQGIQKAAKERWIESALFFAQTPVFKNKENREKTDSSASSGKSR